MPSTKSCRAPVLEPQALEWARAEVDEELLGARAEDVVVPPSTSSTTSWSGPPVFAGEATRLAYMTDEAVEGRDAFLAKRPPDWSPFPWYF